MSNNDYANTNTKTKREWRRKACVIDLRRYRDEEAVKPLLRKRKFLLFVLASAIILASSTMIANAEYTKVTVTVPGWYEVNRISNDRLELKTNMMVYINGQLHRKGNASSAQE